MYLKILLLLLSIACSQVFSKHVNSRGSKQNPNDVVPGLSWLFDMETTLTTTTDNDNDNDQVDSRVCNTKECQAIADEFMRSMNKSVNPCDNFYDYVCGAMTPEVIPAYKPSWGRFELFQQVIFKRIKELLETKPTSDDILPLRQAKKWYRSCMDTESMDKRGLKPIESILMQVGGWPMTIEPEEWDEDVSSWQHIEQHYLETTGSYIFFKMEPMNMFHIRMSPGNLPLDDKLPSEYRDFDEDNYEAYSILIKGVVEMFVEHNKANIPVERIVNDVRDLVNFERKLHKLMNNGWKVRKHMTIDEFIEKYNENVFEEKKKHKKLCDEDDSEEDKSNCSQDTDDSDENDDENDEEELEGPYLRKEKIDFHELFQTMFDLIDQKVNGSWKLSVHNYRDYIKLTELLNKTPKRTIANYMHWHFVSEMLTYTTEEMRDLIFALMENVFDVKQRPPRWLECTEEMKMAPAAGYAFVKKYYSEKTDASVQKMIENIRKQMALEIENSGWMDDEAKKLTVEKLNAIKAIIGFPEWFNNRDIVVRAFKGLIIGTDHFDNVLSYNKYELKDWLKIIFNRYEKINMIIDTQFVDPVEVNAAYNPYENDIALPLADFQPPLFTSKLPWSVNYGVAGVAIGHEIGHAFDDDGIQLGLKGEETNMSETMLDMYYKRAECFLDQFDKYYEDNGNNNNNNNNDDSSENDSEEDDSTDQKRPSKRTRGENIADTTGLHSVYRAYTKMIEKDMDGSDYKLPGFEKYTDNQMFFISFAALWCGTETPKYASMMAESDEHSPRKIRVMGGVSNMNAFAKAFDCPKGSPMNPDDKCSIWTAPKSKTKSSKNLQHARPHKHRKRRRHPKHLHWFEIKANS